MIVNRGWNCLKIWFEDFEGGEGDRVSGDENVEETIMEGRNPPK
jgi:hypothetical protein